MDGSKDADNSETEDPSEVPTTSETSGTITSPGTGSAAWNRLWIVIIDVFIIAAGMGVFFAGKKRKTDI